MGEWQLLNQKPNSSNFQSQVILAKVIISWAKSIIIVRNTSLAKEVEMRQINCHDPYSTHTAVVSSDHFSAFFAITLLLYPPLLLLLPMLKKLRQFDNQLALALIT